MKELGMQMLYDSDAYIVVHIPYDTAVFDGNALDGFEIVDKVSNMGVFLTGAWADAFQKCIDRWQAKVPEQETVENMLARYAVLAQNPLTYH